MRSARALLETYGAFGVVAGDLLVGDSSTDAKAGAELREREKATLVVGDEANLLVHRRRPAPRHAGTSEAAYSARNCYPCTRTVLLPMYLDRTWVCLTTAFRRRRAPPLWVTSTRVLLAHAAPDAERSADMSETTGEVRRPPTPARAVLS